MKTVYFQNIQTLEDLKQAYRALCFKYHPDVSELENATATMQALNQEYETLFAQVKNFRRNAEGEVYQTESNESVDEFRDIIEALIKLKMKNVVVEVIGHWLWIQGGGTKRHKEDLKKLNFRWSQNKESWYYHNQPSYRKKSRRDLTMSDLRNLFDSAKVTCESEPQTNASSPAIKAASPA